MTNEFRNFISFNQQKINLENEKKGAERGY